MIPLPDLSEPLYFLLAFCLCFVIITGRYLLVSGLFYAVFYIWYPAKWQRRKVSNRKYKPNQFRKEIGWSTLTALLFSAAGVITLLLWQKGLTSIYTSIAEYGWWYLPVSLTASLLLHETYYYWVHRWMHRPAIFRLVHKVHHDSNITSPFTAFSFHPLEGLLQAIVLPVTVIILPLHPLVILVQLVIMSLSSVINHLNIEIYPAHFQKHIVGKWFVGATHHALHHKQYKYNLGLYFTFWDKIKKTESPAYDKLFTSSSSAEDDNKIE